MHIDVKLKDSGLIAPNAAVPPVRNVTPTSVSLTSVTLSWTQDSDTQCNSQPSLVHIVINRDDTKRLRSDISINVTEGQTLFQYNLRNLDPGVLYSVSIHVSTDDGRRSAATSIEFETSEPCMHANLSGSSVLQ